ncbi:MAG TPA: hypothetical protein VGR00_00455 [Thermoanaerobaculia bacterium]|jgi:hypothetical protein|nr:hypothetical protein [Thermoanaerobaculia bacterium]
MDAARLLGVLRPHFEALNARWALAGGFALIAWGSTRTTFDLDLVVDEAARPELLSRLTSAGFQVLADPPGFTNLLHPDPDLGRLDLIWLQGTTCERIFAAAVSKPAADGRIAFVPAPEHLVTMKVKAIKSRPTRVFRDGEDLRVLLSLPEIDQNEARGIFESNGLAELYDRIRKAAGQA